MSDIYVTCYGLPVPGFPMELIDPMKDRQTVRVDFIIHRNTTYSTGAWVALEKDGDEFKIVDVALQSHLLRW